MACGAFWAVCALCGLLCYVNFFLQMQSVQVKISSLNLECLVVFLVCLMGIKNVVEEAASSTPPWC